MEGEEAHSSSTNQTSNETKKAEWFDLDEDKNTYMFFWNLPLDMTEDEFIDLTKKCGIIKKKPEKGSPFNIKMYKDKSTGKFKGEGLVCYMSKDSIELAMKILDGYRYGDHTIRCERAKFKKKGDYDPSRKPRPIDKNTKLKQKKKLEKMISWDEPENISANIRKVILKHMFTPEELENPETLLELKEDVEEGCREACGSPQRVDICEKNPDGVVEIIFKDPSQAAKCIEAMDGRHYAGRQVEAILWDGRTKYKIKETDEEAEQRHKKFQEDLML